jgi:5'-3' exonuclease
MADSPLDWNRIFHLINTVKQEIIDNFPYPVIQVGGIEADDIIAVLIKSFWKFDDILIISKDKDFLQLQKYSKEKIRQYDVSARRFLEENDPETFLRSLIIQGDYSDGIPSILSDDDAFVNEKKPKRKVNAALLSKLLDAGDTMFNYLTPEEIRNFHRNQSLIDFDYIPKEIEDIILDEFVDHKTNNDLTTIYKYLTEKQLKPLITKIGDFYQND